MTEIQLPWWIGVDAKKFAPFDSRETAILRTFADQVSRIQLSTLMRVPMSISGPDLEYAGLDALRSVALTVRQIFMDNEAIFFPTVRSLVRIHVIDAATHEQPLVGLDQLGRNWREFMREVVVEDDAGVSLTRETLLREWFYGGNFHADIDGKYEALKGYRPAVVGYLVYETFYNVLGVLNPLQQVIFDVCGYSTPT